MFANVLKEGGEEAVERVFRNTFKKLGWRWVAKRIGKKAALGIAAKVGVSVVGAPVSRGVSLAIGGLWTLYDIYDIGSHLYSAFEDEFDEQAAKELYDSALNDENIEITE